MPLPTPASTAAAATGPVFQGLGRSGSSPNEVFCTIERVSQSDYRVTLRQTSSSGRIRDLPLRIFDVDTTDRREAVVKMRRAFKTVHTFAQTAGFDMQLVTEAMAQAANALWTFFDRMAEGVEGVEVEKAAAPSDKVSPDTAATDTNKVEVQTDIASAEKRMVAEMAEMSLQPATIHKALRAWWDAWAATALHKDGNTTAYTGHTLAEIIHGMGSIGMDRSGALMVARAITDAGFRQTRNGSVRLFLAPKAWQDDARGKSQEAVDRAVLAAWASLGSPAQPSVEAVTAALDAVAAKTISAAQVGATLKRLGFSRHTLWEAPAHLKVSPPAPLYTFTGKVVLKYRIPEILDLYQYTVSCEEEGQPTRTNFVSADHTIEVGTRIKLIIEKVVP